MYFCLTRRVNEQKSSAFSRITFGLVSVEIRFIPERTLYTQYRGSSEKHYVDYIHIKWGEDATSGSEHTVQGLKRAGEVNKIKLVEFS